AVADGGERLFPRDRAGFGVEAKKADFRILLDQDVELAGQGQRRAEEEGVGQFVLTAAAAGGPPEFAGLQVEGFQLVLVDSFLERPEEAAVPAAPGVLLQILRVRWYGQVLDGV